MKLHGEVFHKFRGCGTMEEFIGVSGICKKEGVLWYADYFLWRYAPGNL